MTRMLRILAALLCVLLFAADVCAQTTVTLNASAKVDSADAALTLAEVATIQGPDAAAYAGVVVAESAWERRAVSLADVRSALQAAGANFGRLTLRGAACRIETPVTAAAPVQEKKVVRARTGPEYAVVDVSGPPTLRTAIARRLAAMYGVAHDGIQIAFDDKDRLVLTTPYTEHQVVQVQPAASSTSSRVPLRVTVFAGDRVVAEHRLTADVLVKRDVLVATRELDRRETIGQGDVRVEGRWIAPGFVPPSADLVVGSQARAKIKEGATLDGNDLESPVLVKRGDVVYVQCLSGSVVVQARSRALGSGREGEVIAFQMEGSDAPFHARVVGRGRAVMLVGGGDEVPTNGDAEQGMRASR